MSRNAEIGAGKIRNQAKQHSGKTRLRKNTVIVNPNQRERRGEGPGVEDVHYCSFSIANASFA